MWFKPMSSCEKKIDKSAQIQALDGMKKKRPFFPVSILDVMQKAELICRSENICHSENTNSVNTEFREYEYKFSLFYYI